jgi:hypothetical protein
VQRASWYRSWHRALKAVGIEEDLKPHDLRHTGNTLTAMTGASTKELMARLGQSSPMAVLIYQHATKDHDREIADALSSAASSRRNSSSTGRPAPKMDEPREVMPQGYVASTPVGGRVASSPHVPTNTMSRAHGMSLSQLLRAIRVSRGN